MSPPRQSQPRPLAPSPPPSRHAWRRPQVDLIDLFGPSGRFGANHRPHWTRHGVLQNRVRGIAKDTCSFDNNDNNRRLDCYRDAKSRLCFVRPGTSFTWNPQLWLHSGGMVRPHLLPTMWRSTSCHRKTAGAIFCLAGE